MELNITKFFNEACPKDYSASVMEIGNDAGKATWQAAMDDASEYSLLDSDDKREAFKAHIKGFGAWNDAEIAAFTNDELNALCMQMISGDIREAGLDRIAPDWDAYEADSEDGLYSGRLYKGIDDNIYYMLGE